MAVTHAVPHPVTLPEARFATDRTCVRGDTDPICFEGEMAGRLARAVDGRRGAIVDDPTTHIESGGAPRTRPARAALSGQTPRTIPASNKRERLAHHIGTSVAIQLGWKTSEYTKAEWIALGEQIIADHALHGDDTERVRLLATLDKAAEIPDGASTRRDGAVPPANGHDEIADRVGASLLEEYKEELGVSHAAADLAALRRPTRPALAHELLARIGLNPERAVDMAPPSGAGNPAAGKQPVTAVEYYFTHDKLSASDIRNIADRPLSDLEIAVKLAALPDSLDAEFSRRFDAYARTASDKTIALFDSWLSWIGRTLGRDLGDARIEIHTAQLEYYMRESQVSMNRIYTREDRIRQKVPAIGYIATVHAGGTPHRYFLSTLDGGAHAIPAGMTAPDWISAHTDTVFDLANAKTPANAGTGANAHRDRSRNPTPPSTHTRVALAALGAGGRTDLHTWLASLLLARHDQGRATARAQTPAEHAVDTVLDFIPFRRMIVSLREGNYGAAVRSGTLDIVTLAVPGLCPGLRLSAGAGRGVFAATRKTGGELAAGGMARARAATIALPEVRNRIRTALQSLGAPDGIARGLRPLDADSIVAALRDSHPRVARALARSATRARGAQMRERWWRVPGDTPARHAAETEIGVQNTVTAHAADGSTLPLHPYGGDTVRAYTRIAHTGQRTGSLLVADGEGWLYPSLPVDTLERYRVADADLLRRLGARRPGADGGVALGGRNYARIAGEYIEIAYDRASMATAPAWRVVAPHGARHDIVIHRIFHDRSTGLWRRANVPGLRGGGRETPPPPGQPSSGQSSSAQPSNRASTGQAGRRRPSSNPGSPTREVPTATKKPSLDLAAGDAVATPHLNMSVTLPTVAPTESQLREFQQYLLSRMPDTTPAARVDAVKNLLSRLQSDPRGKAILNAMVTCHETLGRTPNIVLPESMETVRPRQSLAALESGSTWYLDVDALNASTLDDAVNELAAVYNNMTGILQGADPFEQAIRAGRPRLDADLEAAWKDWIGTDKGSYSSTTPPVFIPPPRRIAVDRLRRQLRSARCHGGLNKSTLIGLLKGDAGTRVQGLRIDLSTLELTDLPILPPDVLELDVYGNPITDWSGLSPDLKRLMAAQTGSVDSLLDHLPPGLQALDVSDNELHALAAERLPRGLLHLEAHSNRLRAIPAGLPDTLVTLELSDNFLARLSETLPRGLRKLNVSGNELDYLPVNLPTDMDRLDLSDNLFSRIPNDALPPRLKSLDLSENARLSLLPTLPSTLEILHVESCDLVFLPGNLPAGLRELHADDTGLSSLPAHLPRGLTVLSLRLNELTGLPPAIVELASCDVYLEGNPITLVDLPPVPEGQHGPVFHFLTQSPEPRLGTSHTVMQAVGRWFEDHESEVVAKWNALGEELEASTATRRSATALKRFLDRLRDTRAFSSPEFRASIQEWLAELCKPERRQLLTSTLEMCEGATDSCDDRLTLALSELRALRIHDDVRQGVYNERPADAVRIVREEFLMKKLRDIAYRTIPTLSDPDEVEVYMAYIVKLREPLSLSSAPADMLFYNRSGITERHLDAALREVREAESTELYKALTLNDTWKAFLRQKMPTHCAQAESRLIELAGQPLKEKIHAELRLLGLDIDDLDAYNNIGQRIWRDMEHQIWDPITREFLTSQGLPLPGGSA